MITAIHLLLYADDPEAARAFFRDVLGWPHVDARDGWLIFKTPPGEVAVHPTSMGQDGQSTPQRHEVSFMCDDIEATVAELTAKGVQFTGGIRDHRLGNHHVARRSGCRRDHALSAASSGRAHALKILTAVPDSSSPCVDGWCSLLVSPRSS